MLVLSRCDRRLFLYKLMAAHRADKLRFFGDLSHLADARAFKAFLTPLRNIEWQVFAKRPFAGPDQVLAYLARCAARIGSQFQIAACWLLPTAASPSRGEIIAMQPRSSP